jgi:hypothetical protein
MNESVTNRVPWRSFLIIGMVAMVAVPSWSLSQQPSDDKKPEKVESKDGVFRLVGQPTQDDLFLELVSDDKQPNTKEADRLDRLEKQLDALLKEIKTLRGEKPATPKNVDLVPGAKVESKVIILGDKTAKPKHAEKGGEKTGFAEVTIVGESKDEAKKGEKGEHKEIIIFTDKKDEPKKGEKGEPRIEVIQSNEKSAPAKVLWNAAGPKDGKGLTLVVDTNEGNSTLLSRTTYKMPKEKAEALATFLKDQVKNPVVETKVDGDSIVVTTTPEAQRTIGNFIGLVQGRTVQARFDVSPKILWKFAEPLKVNVNFEEKVEKK